MSDGHVSRFLIPFQNKVTNTAAAEGKSYATVSKKGKSKIRHVCQICNREFTKKCGLTNHLLIHSGVKPFVCEICNKSFTKKCTLTVHLLTHSSERPHACDSCDKSFARKTDLQKHKLVHTGEKRYICDVCNSKFTHQNNLRRHKFKHLPKGVDATDDTDKNEGIRNSLLINKVDRYQTNISKDIKDTVNGKDVSAALQQTSITQGLLNPLIDVPKKINSELPSMSKKSLSVNKINDKLINKNETGILLKPLGFENFPEPIYNVTVRENQTCTSDSNDLANVNSIVNLLVDNVPMNNLDILIEPKEVKERKIKNINNSLPIGVNNDKSHASSCNIGNKTLGINKYQLKNNPFQQAVVKPYVCEICNKNFTKKFTLTTHLLTHSSDRPHACDICNKSFSRKAHLQKHKLVHTGRKPVCKVSNSKFTHQNNLPKHKLNNFLTEVKDKQDDTKNAVLNNENAHTVTSISKVSNDTVNVKKDNSLQPLTDAPNIVNTVFLILPNKSADISNFDKVLIDEGKKQAGNQTKILLKPSIDKNKPELIYTPSDRDKQSFGSDSNVLANINSFENLRFTIIKDQDPLNPLIDLSKQINNGLLVLPSESVNVSSIKELMIDKKQSNDSNQTEVSLKLLNNKNCTEPIFNITDKEERIYESDPSDLENINSVINFMVDNVYSNNLDNLIESAEVKKEREIKDIYNSLPMSINNDKNNASSCDNENKVREMNLGESTANDNHCPPQISIEKQIFNELEKLKMAQESKKNYSKNKLVLCGSEVLENSVQKKDLCQSLSVYNDLEQALAFVSDVIEDAENGQMSLPIDEASQDTIGPCQVPKNKTEDFQVLTIPSDVTEDTMNDVQLLINNDVHDSSDLKILGGLTKDGQDLNSLSDVTGRNVSDVQLLSLMNDNIPLSESQVMVHIDENGQISHSFNADQTFVQIQPIADNNGESKVNISDEVSLALPVLDCDKEAYHDFKKETSVKKDLFNSKDPFSCDICCEPFEDQKDFLLHVTSHISDDQKTCYLCDLDLDSNVLLRKHILTHYEDDDDDISLDEDFSKIAPLTAGDVFLGDIDKIDLDDEDFEEKVARMYALAHVELSMDGYDTDSDDDATRLYSYSQIDRINKDGNAIGKSLDQFGKNCFKSTTVCQDLNFNMLSTSSGVKADQDLKVNLENTCFNASKLDTINQLPNTYVQRFKDISKLSSGENCNLTMKYIAESSVDNIDANSTEVSDLKNISLSDKNLVFETALNNSLSMTEKKNEKTNKIVINIINKVDAFLKENISDRDISDVLTCSSIQSSSFQTKSAGLNASVNENSFSNVQSKPAVLEVNDKNSFSNIQSSFPSKPANLDININENSGSNVVPSISLQSNSSELDININKNSGSNIQPNSLQPKLQCDVNINRHYGIQPSIIQTKQNKLDINAIKSTCDNIQPSSKQLKPAGIGDNINENSSNSTTMLKIVENKKPPFVCSFCDKTFTRKMYLHEHYLMHAGIKQYACEVCDKKFTKKCALTIHSLIHTQERKYRCTECSKTFSRKIDFQKHTMIHTGLKPYACDICNKAFNHQNNLRRHKRLHYNNKPFICYICSTGFSERIGLLSHVKIHIKEAEMKSADGKLSENIRNCLNSMKEKLYECSECKMLFARRDRLMKHKLTHTIKNPHQCEICGRGFQKKDQLKQHLSNHIRNEFQDIRTLDGNIEDIELTSLEPTVQPTRKTHTCDQCFKVYSKSSALKCHYLTHTGERPHKCHLCNKAFAQRTNLKRHLLSHAGIKPFKCNICHKNFARKPYLRKHYLSHTSDELFTLLGNLPDE